MELGIPLIPVPMPSGVHVTFVGGKQRIVLPGLALKPPAHSREAALCVAPGEPVLGRTRGVVFSLP